MKIYIGIDVSKLHLDLHHHQQSTQIPNTAKAIRRWLKALPPAAVLVCEASGGYESLLVTLAHAAQRPIARLNARQVRDFAKAKGRLAKTDKIDAQILVDFAEAFHPEPLGLAFVRALRRMLPDIPVMVVSGRMEDTMAGEFKTLGVTSRLDKPFTEVQLAEALKNLLAPK